MKPTHRAHVDMIFHHWQRNRHAVHQWQLEQAKERALPVRLITLYASVATALLIGLWFTRYPY